MLGVLQRTLGVVHYCDKFSRMQLLYYIRDYDFASLIVSESSSIYIFVFFSFFFPLPQVREHELAKLDGIGRAVGTPGPMRDKNGGKCRGEEGKTPVPITACPEGLWRSNL